MNQRQIFGIIVLLLLLYLSHNKIIELAPKQIVIIFILQLTIVLLLSNSLLEGMTSNEAVQNLGSVYNSSNAVLTNLQVTGTLKVGNSILMNGDSTATNKIEIYQNSDGADPKLYFDKTGKLGISGTGGSYLSNSGSSFAGDVSIGSNLILDGTNKWILHTPDDGRKTLYIAPRGTSDWNWDSGSSFDATTGKVRFPLPTGTYGAYILDGASKITGLAVGNGKLSENGFCSNCEDSVILLPGYGMKLWDQKDPPNYATDGNWKGENNTNMAITYAMWGSNKMDYYSVYKL
jgi:hypothetical protein